jgi:hypothetical protein
MKIKDIKREGKHLNTSKKYHLYKLSRLHMNDAHIDTYNLILKVLQELGTIIMFKFFTINTTIVLFY